MILNGAYLDEDIQSRGPIQQEWNFTMGYDTSAIVMSIDDDVPNCTTRHHRRQRTCARFSINWGDSALVLFREMGLLLSSPAVAQVYLIHGTRTGTDWTTPPTPTKTVFRLLGGLARLNQPNVLLGTPRMNPTWTTTTTD